MTFAVDVIKFAKKTGLRMDVVVRKFGFDGFAGILLRSPVLTGRFRGSNRISVLNADLTVEPEGSSGRAGSARAGDTRTGGEEAYAVNVLSTAQAGTDIVLSNNLPYAVPIEDGHSGQAPVGVYGPVLIELQASVDKLVGETKREIP